MKTRPALYEVVGRQSNHLWLEVLEGNDSGIRVSVPRRCREYDADLQKRVLELSPGEVYEFELESEETVSPNWRIAEIDEPETDVRVNTTT